MRRAWGEPPWRREAVPKRALESSAPEVAVIGGGLTGVSAAYHLAKRGVRTVLLEAGIIGDGASGRSGGIVLEGTALGVLEGTGACLPALESLVREESIECGLRLQGCWEIAHHRENVRHPLPWNDEGLPVYIVSTVAGGTLDPMALVTGLARAAVCAGATVHERMPVRRVITENPPVLELDGAVIRPGSVVVALNAWAQSMLPNLGAVTSALTFACATEAHDTTALREIGLGAGMPFYTVDLPYLWGRQLADGRMVFGSGLAFGSPQELEALDIGAAEPRAVLDPLEARVRALNPALGEVRFSARWAGPVAMTDGRSPFLGRLPDMPAVLVAGGYAGHGVALAVWAGKVMARAIVKGGPLPPWGALRSAR
jgi:gamma-glutamylputrescine oxidase